MKFHMPGAELFVPDGRPEADALRDVTHLAVAAHQDDIEIMAYRGILECFGRKDRGFMGVTVTDGAGSPRAGIYGRYTDAEMQAVRRGEQKTAARIGEYRAMALLDFPSSAVKDPSKRDVVEDLLAVLGATRPSVVYTHNLADKHDTHVATALRLIAALRELPAGGRPKEVYGCEVWRDLDWMVDTDKVAFDVSERENLSAALVGVFDSQISGGKRYDLATLGRRRAHATYHASHGTDTATALIFAMNLTPLIEDPRADIEKYVGDHIRRFADDVAARLKKHSRG